jgi:hypothetical protein
MIIIACRGRGENNESLLKRKKDGTLVPFYTLGGYDFAKAM